MRAVIITTLHRGVFFGYVDEKDDLTKKTLSLKKAKMAIEWGTTKGIMELCDIGPNKESRIGAQADIPVLHDVTAIFNVTSIAEKSWALF